MTTQPHPLIAYDQDRIDAISGRLDLRDPNRQALEAVARRLDQAAGAPFEAVCEIATAVGKTYLAAGLIEYLAENDIRNILVVVPGKTVRTKTIDNFTLGHPKSVPGMDADLVVVTADNFNTGGMRAAFDDPSKVKLYIFTVQALLNPNEEDKRKTREFQEWLGREFYDYLASRNDLVVIGDEHHVYAETAQAFNAAITDLNAMATIGLTATADPSQRQNIVYQYDLAMALRDKLVKTPVLVGRTDDNKDLATQLADGLMLLEAKQTAADSWAEVTGRRVNAVMLVIAERIDQAEHVKEVLARTNLLGADAENAVLVVHSQSADEALAQLAQVEDPDSPIRVIVNVSMLKEGWDVKNIFVIASLRPSVSDTLTEQTLGRGLRLPYGKHTGMELLDTLEVLSHDRYEKLLAEAGRLIRGITSVRAAISEPVTATATTDGTGAAVLKQGDGGRATPPAPGGGSTFVVVEATPAGGAAASQLPPDDEFLIGPDAPIAPGLQPGQTPSGFVIATTDARIEQVKDETANTLVAKPQCDPPLRLPRIRRKLSQPNFTLDQIDDEVFEGIGKQVASAHDVQLDRKVLDVIEDDDGNPILAPRMGEAVTAAVVSLPLGGIKSDLVSVILNLDFVPSDKAASNGAKRLVQAAIDAAGGENKLGTYHEVARKLVVATLRKLFKAQSAVEEYVVEWQDFAPVRQSMRHKKNPNRFGPFDKQEAYGPWERSSHDVNWFDSEPERALANLLDADLAKDGVEVWARIQRGDGADIEWQGGGYTPDFYAKVADVNYLLEVKADKDMENADVLAKKDAAKMLARKVTDSGEHGAWKYLLISETELKRIRNVADLLRIAGSK